MKEPNTFSRGESNDVLLLLVAVVVVVPVAVIVWLASLAIMRSRGLSRWWPLGAAVALAGVLALAGTPQAALGATTAALGTFTVTGSTVGAMVAAGVAVLGRVALATSLVAVPVGLAAAAMTPGPPPLPGVPSPALRRRAARAAKRELRRVERAAAGHKSTSDRPVLGVVHGRGDLPPAWTQGKYLVLPAEVENLPRLVIGRPGQGKSVYLLREVFCAGLAHRQVVFADCKAEAGFAAEVEAAYAAGWALSPSSTTSGQSPTVHRWPAEPLNAWTGGAAAVANRLLSVWTFDTASLWYREVVDMALTLALHAPGDPVTCSRDVLRRVQPDTLTQLWQGHPDESGLVRSLGSKNKLDDVSIRLGNLLGALGGLLDGDRPIGAADLTILSLPTMGKEHQAAALLRVALADLAHYVSTRKPPGARLLVICDEFSALPGGREHAIHLSERGRSALAAVVLAVQSGRGLGDDDDADRLIGAAGMIALFGTAEPERILKLAGTVEIVRRSATVGGALPTETFTEATEYRVDANDVRALPPGFAYILASGRAQRIKVLRTPAGERPCAAAPGVVVDVRELPAPPAPRQGQAPTGSPAASLDPPPPPRVRRYRPGRVPGETAPPTDHQPQEDP